MSRVFDWAFTQQTITFDDVLIRPKFSKIKSRKDVSLYSKIKTWGMDVPVISANMDTITGIKMANTMSLYGARSCLHRFWTIEENVEAFMSCPLNTAVSFGLGEYEKSRVSALINEKAFVFILDVAHGAQISVVEQTVWFKKTYPNAILIVGNFATGDSVLDFISTIGDAALLPDAIKVGIGPGSACTTRIKTGCGVPQLSAILDCSDAVADYNIAVIADGGIKTPGDIAKALAGGAAAVMVGGMLAGTEETPGEVIWDQTGEYLSHTGYKSYRGSASKDSYTIQGKDSSWRTAEGEAFKVSYKGSVVDILKDIEGGLRSAFTYVGALNLKEFQEKAKFDMITINSVKENGAHGKNTI